jgi:hypothetical protein
MDVPQPPTPVRVAWRPVNRGRTKAVVPFPASVRILFDGSRLYCGTIGRRPLWRPRAPSPRRKRLRRRPPPGPRHDHRPGRGRPDGRHGLHVRPRQAERSRITGVQPRGAPRRRRPDPTGIPITLTALATEGSPRRPSASHGRQSGTTRARHAPRHAQRPGPRSAGTGEPPEAAAGAQRTRPSRAGNGATPTPPGPPGQPRGRGRPRCRRHGWGKMEGCSYGGGWGCGRGSTGGAGFLSGGSGRERISGRPCMWGPCSRRVWRGCSKRSM